MPLAIVTHMKWAIVGSRNYPKLERVQEFVRFLSDSPVPPEKWKYPRNPATIVSGGAPGVDSVAAREARECGLPVEEFPAEWNRQPDGSYDRTAGFRRNQLIVDASDIIVAFWDGVSSGTRDTIVRAQKAGKPVIIYGPTGAFLPPPR